MSDGTDQSPIGMVLVLLIATFLSACDSTGPVGAGLEETCLPGGGNAVCWKDLEFPFDVTALVMTDRGLLAGTHGDGLFRWGGSGWQYLGLEGAAIRGIGEVSGEDARIVAGIGPGSDPPMQAYIVASDDDGQSWAAMDGGLGAAEPETWWLTSLAIDPREQGRILAAGDGFALRSDDGAATWEFVLGEGSPSLGLPIHALAFDPHDDRVWAGAGREVGSGAILYFSEDRGETWSSIEVDPQADAGLARGPNRIQALSRHPHGPQSLFAGMSGLLVASDDGGTTWQPVLLEHRSFDALFWLGGTLHAVTTGVSTGSAEGRRVRIFASADDGDSWEEVPSPAEVRTSVSRRAVAVVADGAVFIGTGAGVWRMRVGEGEGG